MFPKLQLPMETRNLSVTGKVSGGPFPLTITSKARDIDIGNLSGEVLKMTGTPYALSGNCKSFIFEGTLVSPRIRAGQRGSTGRKDCCYLSKDKKNIVQGASLNGGVTFRGNDLEFNANANAGKISTSDFRNGKKISATGQISQRQR